MLWSVDIFQSVPPTAFKFEAWRGGILVPGTGYVVLSQYPRLSVRTSRREVKSRTGPTRRLGKRVPTLKLKTEGTGGRAQASDWPADVIENPRSSFDWLVSAIVVAAAEILPT